MRSLSVLLCGYGWFAGIPEGETNNAELIARVLDGETLVCGDVRATVRGMTMPVLWRGAFEPVQAAIDAQKPDLVLALGTDARAGALRPEPFGVNWRRGRDAGDTPEENSPILSGEAEWLRGTLPYAQMVRAMLAAGVPARLGALTPAPADAPLTVQSTTGMYLCNYMTYRLAKLSRETGLRAGFMHVPTQTAFIEVVSSSAVPASQPPNIALPVFTAVFALPPPAVTASGCWPPPRMRKPKRSCWPRRLPAWSLK